MAVDLHSATVIGGGPGGLYAAILLKRDRPDCAVRVFERNAAGDTYGFGVAFHAMTLRALADADGPSRAALDGILRPWDDVRFKLRGVERRIGGHGFAGCSRHRLLALLEARAREVGVELEFGVAASESELDPTDLVVAADGANSPARERHPDHFGPTVDFRPNRYVWLGTTKPLDAMNFLFAEAPEGVFVAHAYPHSADRSTWIVEADEATFLAGDLDNRTEAETAAFLRAVFHDELDGHDLEVNHSQWRRFPSITCDRWVRGNVALLGDAKATVHYSIGSGTKIAMEDAVALNRALHGEQTVAAALHRYEAERRPVVAELQRTAFGSMRWFETYPLHWAMDPDAFVFAGVTRKANETFATIEQKAPELTRAATAALGDADAPIDASLAVGGLVVERRIVGDAVIGAVADAGSYRHLVGPKDRADIHPVPGPPTLVAVDVGPGSDPDVAADAVRVTAARSNGAVVGASILPTAAVLELAIACVGAGAAFIDVTGGSEPVAVETQLLAADLVRHTLGVPTLIAVPDVDAANTALAAGRADLVMVARIGADR